MKPILTIISIFLSLYLYAQGIDKETILKDKNEIEIESAIIGEWHFVKAFDSNLNEVNFIYKGKHTDGREFMVGINRTNISINEDHSFTKNVTGLDTEFGTWKVTSEGDIEYSQVIPKGSKQGKMIEEHQKIIEEHQKSTDKSWKTDKDGKWKTDRDGNYLIITTEKIISLSENEMRIESTDKIFQLMYTDDMNIENKYILVFQKQNSLK